MAHVGLENLSPSQIYTKLALMMTNESHGGKSSYTSSSFSYYFSLLQYDCLRKWI